MEDTKQWIFKIQQMKKIFKSDIRKDSAMIFSDVVIPSACMTIITGETGIGKTTLLNMLGLMDELSFENKDDNIWFYQTGSRSTISYRDLSPSDIELLRFRNFGFMFQQDHLIDTMTGWENIVLPYLIRNKKVTYRAVKEKARAIIKDFNFADMLQNGLLDRSPSTFSGGQRQRTALIRSLIHKPSVIFADEPFASVNEETIMDIKNALCKEAESGTTIIMVIHDTHIKYFDNVPEVLINTINLKNHTKVLKK